MRYYLVKFYRRKLERPIKKQNPINSSQNKITPFNIILDNYKVSGSSLDLIEGIYDFSKSTFFVAVKVYAVSMVMVFAYYINCTLFPKDILLSERITTVYTSLCPDPENIYITIIKFKLASLFLGMTIGSIKFFHGKS